MQSVTEMVIVTDMKSAEEIATETGLTVEQVQQVIKSNAEYDAQTAKVEEGHRQWEDDLATEARKSARGFGYR